MLEQQVQLHAKELIGIYAMISIYKPHPEHGAALIDSKHCFGAYCKSQPDLIQVGTFKNSQTGQRLEIALWYSAESTRAASPTLMKATENDDFETWEMEEMRE